MEAAVRDVIHAADQEACMIVAAGTLSSRNGVHPFDTKRMKANRIESELAGNKFSTLGREFGHHTRLEARHTAINHVPKGTDCTRITTAEFERHSDLVFNEQLAF
jgi:hypothetical protein